MKKRLEKILSKVGTDKYYHFVVGFFLYLGLIIFIMDIAALSLVLIIATIGEIKDHYSKDSKFDVEDIWATVLPAILMFLIYN